MIRRNDNLFEDCLTGDTIDSLGNFFCIIENPKLESQSKDFPIKDNTLMSVIVLAGAMECNVDMTVHRINTQGMLLILPSQIVENFSFSDDFKGYCILLSSSFLANMPISHTGTLITEVKRTGFYQMDRQFFDPLENYVKMMQSVLRTTENNYKYEIITHLTIAYYYGLGTYLHKVGNTGDSLTRYEQISDSFIELVRKNCHIHRDMDFYSDSLCLSSKHINLAVKKVTGDNAMKWIERYTVLKAKSLLKTTSQSISEVAYNLNFPTPSDFGKYFKKFTGYSPKAFRNS